jgi:hypothetical protein
VCVYIYIHIGGPEHTPLYLRFRNGSGGEEGDEVQVEEVCFMETSDLTTISRAHVSKPAHLSKDVSWGGTEELDTGTEYVDTGTEYVDTVGSSQSSRDKLLGPLLSAQGHLVSAQDSEREREKERKREDTGNADTAGNVVGAVGQEEASCVGAVGAEEAFVDSFVAAPVEGDGNWEGAR